MAKLSLWHGPSKRSNDYRFMDRTISEFMHVSGCDIFIHKYVGTLDSTGNPVVPTTTTQTFENDSNTQTLISNTSVGSQIQDVLFLENRDRNYDQNVYVMRGIYSITDTDFNLSQFGLFMASDTKFVTIHMNDMFNVLGRRVIPGDVIELPNLLDENPLNGGPAVPAFYQVEEATRAAEGYGANWLPFLYRLKIVPMQNSQEFATLLNQQTTNPFGVNQGTLASILTATSTDDQINNQLLDEARAIFLKRNFETQQFWIIPGDNKQNAWIYAGDGIPSDGAQLAGSGTKYPTNPNEGDWFLRTDYQPSALFLFKDQAWRYQEQDYRGEEWMAAHRLLQDFITNDTITTFDDQTTAPERVPLSQSVKPKADF